MSAIEWLDLEVLDTELATARTHLAEVNAFRRVGDVQLLEQEVAELEVRRNRLLARLTNRLSELPYLVEQPPPTSAEDVETYQEQSPTEPANKHDEIVALEKKSNSLISDAITLLLEQEADAEIGKASAARRVVTQSDVPFHAHYRERTQPMWEELTASHIEEATDVLNTRRSAILARQGDEIRALDTEQTEIEFLEESIKLFTQKYKNGHVSGD